MRAELEIEAHRLTADEAQLLQDEVGVLAIVVDRVTYTAPNRPAVWYRGLFKRSYRLGVELSEEDW